MKLIGVTAYGIRIRNEEKHDLELHDIYGAALLDYLKKIAEESIDEYARDSILENVFSYNEADLQVIKNKNGQNIYEILSLKIKTGEYGEESEIVDPETGEVTHVKKPGEADVMPFGCCILVPCGEFSEGIVLTQSLGRNGITSAIKKRFNEYIKEIDVQLRVVMNPLVPKQYMENVLKNGVLKSIRLISFGIPDDDADRYGIDRGTEKSN